MDQAKKDFVSKKRIAVFGVSRSDHKFGNSTYKELKQRGYDVVAVHPELKFFDGDPCYESLNQVAPPPEAVLICVSPKHVPQILKEVAQNNIKNVWLQQGSESSEAVTLGKELGLSAVNGGCILMYAEPVKSIHSFHRWIWKLVKKY